MQIRIRLIGVLVAGMLLCWPAVADTSAFRAEQELFASINHARRAHGLAPLQWNESLATAARPHAQLMAKRGAVQHGFEGEPGLAARVKQTGAHFHWLSENVAEGPTSLFIHNQFMKSPPHRANILDRDMDSLGVGVVERDRQLFAVEDFSQAR